MPIDALCLSAITSEYSCILKGNRLNKVKMSDKDSILLSFKGKERNRTLLISCGHGEGITFFTNVLPEGPDIPPSFCMVLRKYILGSIVSEVIQIPNERVFYISFSTTSTFGPAEEYRLIVELLGRHSNIILTNKNNLILDCIRKIDLSSSSNRSLLPGIIYELPKSQNKIPFFEISEEKQPEINVPIGTPSENWIINNISGISPLMSREIVFSIYGCTDYPISEISYPELMKALLNAAQKAKQQMWTPVLLLTDTNEPVDFYCFPVRQYSAKYHLQQMDSFSDLLSYYYSEKVEINRKKQLSGNLYKIVKTHRERISRKIEQQKIELNATKNRDEYRINGDIISANFSSIKRGASSLTADDFYTEDLKKKTIPLDSSKTAQQNAAAYYKKYKKLKNAEIILTEQIAIGINELEYLDSVLEELGRVKSQRELSEIMEELASTGYIKRKTSNSSNNKAKKINSNISRVILKNGMEALVGKNNIQNDKVTFQLASNNDLWFHVKKLHGAHVVIRSGGNEPDDTTIMEAASLAVQYSEAAGKGKTYVDYTKIKNVKRSPSNKPGLVVYKDYLTVCVNDEDR